MTPIPAMPSTRTRLLALLGAVGMLLALAVGGEAGAHGSTTDPPSRVYGCFERWGSDFQNPDMATEDPMCWQAWQADSNAMWNWSSLSRDNVGGDYEAAIPDGQLCSGGLTKDGRYAAFDEPGLWQAVAKPRQFTLTVTDGANHGADYLLVYITEQGFDPTTERLGWGDLELVTTTGSQSGADGVYEAQVDAGDRTGRHIVFAIWLASHKDESYYMCSDVIFGAGSDPTDPPPTDDPTDPATGDCTAAIDVVGDWGSGWQGTVSITADSGAVDGWDLSWDWPGGQTIRSAWNTDWSQSGSTVTASDVGWNGQIAAGQSREVFGFTASGSPDAPQVTCASG